MKHEPFNESIEMYLKTVSELTHGDEPVPISALAQRLGVSTVSATEMVHRLKNHGFIEHIPYKGVSLTLEGGRHANDVIRSHRLWERFMVDCLGLAWDRVHELACRLEHATDPEVTEALASFLIHPSTCPHGNPIPSLTGSMPYPQDLPLNEMQPGQWAILSRIHPESELVLGYLAARGLKPGQFLIIEAIEPLHGPLMVAVEGQVHPLGQEIAAHIFVRPVEDSDNGAHA